MAMSIVAGARINPEIWERFKLYCLKKHGKLHSVLGMELERALLFYMAHVPPSPSSPGLLAIAHEGHTDDVAAVQDARQAVDEEVAKVVEVLARYCEPGAQMAYSVLALRIGEATGHYGDKHVNRVIRKLYAHGVIEPDHSAPKGKVFIIKDLSLWTGGPHGHPDPAGGLRGERRGAYRLQV
jgi:hypothetical protein